MNTVNQVLSFLPGFRLSFISSFIQYSSTPTLHYSSFYQTMYAFSPSVPTDHGLSWTRMILFIRLI